MEEEAASLTESLDEKQIWRAEGDEVAGKRSQQDEFIDDHLVLVSPACKLPEDLVREIFVASLLMNANSFDVPNLRTVRLGAINHLGSPSQETLLSFLETPSLRGFRGWSDRIAFSELPLAWEHLQHLNLIKSACLSAQEALSLLTRCHSLVTCALGINDHSRSQGHRLMPCRQVHLEQLCLRGEELSSGFFENLNLPVLRIFEFRGSVYSDVLPIIPLLPTISRLKRISLDTRFFNIADFIEGLRLVPSLQELCIRDSSDGLSTPRATTGYTGSMSKSAAGSTLASLDARFFRQMELDIGPLAPSGVELSLSYSPDLPPTVVFWPSKYCPSEGLEIQGTEWTLFSDMW
ncbi:hypothetical protein C8J57DRAFT_1519220 [Mycena rebaudengoi]|nr:hypothetical protein C8J57DRAFT_1519220 [Mycena rebaudengoi]